MMNKILFWVVFVVLYLDVGAQTTTLTFTGRDADNHYIPMSGVVVSNLTRNWQDTILYPDTILVLGNVGIGDWNSAERLQLSQNVPNPFDGVSEFSLILPKGGKVEVEIHNMNGKKMADYQNTMDAGTHTFRIQLANPQSYVLTARSGRESASVKILNKGCAGANTIRYLGEVDERFAKSETKENSNNPFLAGDRMRYVAYAFVYGQSCASQEIVKDQNTSEDIVLHFDVVPSDSLYDGRPCGNLPVVTDHEGNVYHTVQIGMQCWTRENMRCKTSPSTGTTILETNANNYSFTGKKAYCVYGDSSNTQLYGLLYNWNAAVDTFNTTYTETSVNTSETDAVSATFNGHRRGICPEGWHVPSDSEWTVLENYVKSLNSYQCGNDSTHIAKALASSFGWRNSQTTCAVGCSPLMNNAVGYNAVPAGNYYGWGFGYFNENAFMWSSSQSTNAEALSRNLSYYSPNVIRNYYYKDYGYSVRCIWDESSNVALPTVTTLPVSANTHLEAVSGGIVVSSGFGTVTARGICWSTSENPALSDSHTVNGSGLGIFTSTITGLQSETTYYVRAYATNSLGTSYGNQVEFTTDYLYQPWDGTGLNPNDAHPCEIQQTVADHEGNIYHTVQIGTQCWTKENMRCLTSPRTGTSMLEMYPNNCSYTGKKAYYVNGNPSYASTYGLLYNWNAAVDTFNTAYTETSVNTSGTDAVSATFSGHRRGICPEGWHVPSDSDWTVLENYVGAQSVYQCNGNSSNVAKALAATSGWENSSVSCGVGNSPSSNNASGFTAFPAGFFGSSFGNISFGTYFWCATQYHTPSSHYYVLNYNEPDLYGGITVKSSGFSVRCLRD